MKRKKVNVDRILIIGIGIFALVSGVFAYTATAPVHVENVNDGGVVNISLPEGETLEGVFGTASDYCDETSATTTSCNWELYSLDVDYDTTMNTLAITGAVTMSGENALTGTTTIRYLDASIQSPLDFQQATSSPDNNVSDPHTKLLVGTYAHTGDDLLCTDVWVDIYTANGLFAYDLEVGTSTSATSSAAAYLIDATTDAHEITTTTVTVLNKQDDEGTNTDEVWILENGHYLAANIVFNTANATSGRSFLAAGGNLTAGTLHANCRTRY